MNRLLCIGTLATIAMLYFLKLADPQSLIFDVVSVGQGATMLHMAFASILLFIGVGEYFTHRILRLVSGYTGLGLIVLAIFSTIYPILDAPLKPFDLVFVLEAGIILALAGISVSEEEQEEARLLRQYDFEQHAEDAQEPARKIAYN